MTNNNILKIFYLLLSYNNDFAFDKRMDISQFARFWVHDTKVNCF